MNGAVQDRCDDARMSGVLAEVAAEPARGIAAIDAALADHPRDARLHFLKGSLLVGEKRFVAAHRAMSRAVEIEPGYDLARFQLGFFELTSGEAEAALQTWAPLDALPSGHWMRFFVEGLRHLAADEFADCIASLRAGIAANQENPPLNADMALIVEECERLCGGAGGGDGGQDAGDGAEVSATSFLLGTLTGDKGQGRS